MSEKQQPALVDRQTIKVLLMRQVCKAIKDYKRDRHVTLFGLETVESSVGFSRDDTLRAATEILKSLESQHQKSNPAVAKRGKGQKK